ncbi:MAG: class I SAM-dependent methyltransferase [Pseudomonadota bacterium]|nr:class I SAM-dependent methyltransferase [Pseudomonadota bacterium]MDQ3159732.1 class I SAM-dependent methyltransferase [Pseudomonadota bacterium]
MNNSFAYDLLKYPAHIHQQMLPALLAPIARIHGIQVASPRQCHLLEVGCGDGLQLITLAMAYPSSRFVGVDMSTSAIARGEALRTKLGLDNLRLVAADLMTWDPGESPFDYILAHGFFSWVPEPVRLRLLHLCQQSLAPQGVSYISYNAFPGCHLRRMVWEMMRSHVQGNDEPVARIAEARNFLEWLAQDVLGDGSYSVAVRSEAKELLHRTHTSVLFHDDLAQINQPYALESFLDLAAQHGLQFLAEADYCEMSDAVVDADAIARLDAITDGHPQRKEQYRDFLKGRRFRQTLLCHAAASLHRNIDGDAIASLSVVGDLRAQEPAEDAPMSDVVRFVSAAGAAITTDHPFVKAALTSIATEFPTPIPVARLLSTGAREATCSTSDQAALIEALSRGYRHGLVTLVCDGPEYANGAGNTPRLSPLARLQLEASSPVVFSLRPGMIDIDSVVTREMLLLLDGTRTRQVLLQDLSARMAELPAPQGEPARDGDWWRDMLAPQLEQGLEQAARMALLVDA